MSARFATEDEVAHWDELVAEAPGGGQVWQGRDYAEVKKLGHYLPRFVMAGGVPVTVHVKRVPAVGQLWYVPKGPMSADAEDAIALVAALAPLARRYGAFAVKIEPAIPDSEDARNALTTAGFLPVLPVIPNPSTIVLDIDGPDDETVLASLGKDARYSIRRAGRDGVTVRRVPVTEENCRRMHALLAETAEGRFGIRPYVYYRTFWQRFEATGNGQLFFAELDGEIVAGAFAMKLGRVSTYKDGASVRKRSAYGASHLLQWEVIRWARQQGCIRHDLCGAPPANQLGNIAHPLHGIGLFKSSFSPVVTDYVGAWDLPLRPQAYRLWVRFAEKAARRMSLVIRHDPYY